MSFLSETIIKRKVQDMEEELIIFPNFIPPEFRISTEFRTKRKEWLITTGKYFEFAEMDHEWNVEKHRKEIHGGLANAVLFRAYSIQEFIDNYPQFQECVNRELLIKKIFELELILSKKK